MRTSADISKPRLRFHRYYTVKADANINIRFASVCHVSNKILDINIKQAKDANIALLIYIWYACQ